MSSETLSNPTFINFAYLVASVLFIVGLKGLTHPRTAVRGNLLGSLGMLLAVIVTLLDRSIIGFGFIIGGIAVGGFSEASSCSASFSRPTRRRQFTALATAVEWPGNWRATAR